MAKSKSKERKFLAMWCNEGLEFLADVTAMEQDAILAGLKGEVYQPPFSLEHLKLRAQFNQQRHYEIWAFTTRIPEVSLREWFQSTPQAIADSIRGCGVKIYSDRKTTRDLIT